MSFRPASRRAQMKAQTRAKILTVARDLFGFHGFDIVSLREIAIGSGLSTGAIFANWPSKDALFAEAMGRPHLAVLTAIAPKEADALLSRWAA
jgi:AcrR family transcriptional regulator